MDVYNIIIDGSSKSLCRTFIHNGNGNLNSGNLFSSVTATYGMIGINSSGEIKITAASAFPTAGSIYALVMYS